MVGGRAGRYARTVLYRRFGRTGIDVSVFSCGGMRYQQSWSRTATVTPASQVNVDATVARAFELGINHVETARGYGTSEDQLGKTLARHPRDRFVLQTKLRPAEDPKVFAAQLEESFGRLGVSVIDLLAIHGVNDAAALETTLRPGGCLEVAESFRRAGRIRALGFSTHAPTSVIVRAIQSNRFDYVNLHYYYIFQDNLPALVAARDHDLGVFIISPSDKGGRLHRAPERLRALVAPLSPMVFNDLWCLAHPTIHTLSIGAARPSDFDEHVGALAQLDEARSLLPPIVARLESAYRDAVGDDFSCRWQQGLREWTELPGKVNVKRILWLRNLVHAFDLLDFAQERYASMSPDDAWVPGARATGFDDAEMIAALPDSPYRDRIPRLLREAHELLSNRAVKPLP